MTMTIIRSFFKGSLDLFILIRAHRGKVSAHVSAKTGIVHFVKLCKYWLREKFFCCFEFCVQKLEDGREKLAILVYVYVPLLTNFVAGCKQRDKRRHMAQFGALKQVRGGAKRALSVYVHLGLIRSPTNSHVNDGNVGQ